MIQDTVTEEQLLSNPRFVLIFFALTCFAFIIIDPSQSVLGHFLAPAIGDPAESGFYGRFVTSFTLAILFLLNLVAISFLPEMLEMLEFLWTATAAGV